MNCDMGNYQLPGIDHSLILPPPPLGGPHRFRSSSAIQRLWLWIPSTAKWHVLNISLKKTTDHAGWNWSLWAWWVTFIVCVKRKFHTRFEQDFLFAIHTRNKLGWRSHGYWHKATAHLFQDIVVIQMFWLMIKIMYDNYEAGIFFSKSNELSYYFLYLI